MIINVIFIYKYADTRGGFHSALLDIHFAFNTISAIHIVTNLTNLDELWRCKNTFYDKLSWESSLIEV